MKLEGRTILITGGTSGIGFEMARQLLARGNTVLITGRDQRKLEEAKSALRGAHTFQSDASSPESRASKYILTNIRLSRSPVARSTSV